jgi:hypothetical protein
MQQMAVTFGGWGHDRSVAPIGHSGSPFFESLTCNRFSSSHRTDVGDQSWCDQGYVAQNHPSTPPTAMPERMANETLYVKAVLAMFESCYVVSRTGYGLSGGTSG